MLKAYDHPTGIPFNWDGRRYDIPTLDFLQFFQGLFLVVYGIVVVPAGTLVILITKYPFLHAKGLTDFIKSFRYDLDFVQFPPFWLFYLMIVIILGPLTLAVIIMMSPMVGLNCINIYYQTKTFKLGLLEAYYLLVDLDRITYSFGWNFLLLSSRGPPRSNPIFGSRVVPTPQVQAPPPIHPTSDYWNMFISNCQEQCRMSVDADWINQEDVGAAMPSILTCIPAMAVLDLLAISAERGAGQQVIYWGRGEDADVCDDSRAWDDLAEYFWPKLMEIKSKLEGLTKQEIDYMMAKLCAVEQEVRPMLEQELTRRMQMVTPGRLVEVHRVCGLVNSLVLALLRVKKMQDRLHRITK